MLNIKPISERIEIIPRKKLKDGRGWFLKVMTGFENGLPESTGEIYTVYSENGASRGGHYHKVATEWFTLLTGKSVLLLKDLQTSERLTIDMDTIDPVTIVVPPFIAHRFDGINNIPFLLIAYTNFKYHPEDTIDIEI